MTYTLTGNDDDDDVHASTRLPVRLPWDPRGTLNADTGENNEVDTVTVTATDPFGETTDETTGATTQGVTITINDVNEAPAIATGATRASVDEGTPIADAS